MSALSVLSPVNQRGAGGDTPAITPSLLSGQGGALVPACLARRHAARPLQWSDDRGGSAVQLTALCDNIEATHHAFLREMLPRLSLLTEAMARAYGESHPRLCALREAFANFRDAMKSNLDEEAGAVFPLCRRLDTAGRHVPFHGTLTAAIRLLDAERPRSTSSRSAPTRTATLSFSSPSRARYRPDPSAS
jgi:iron-sulfur cluster repair protein YtfE (RIC family)